MEKEELKTVKELRKCTKSLSATSLDTSAYFRGLSEMKGIDLGKHRKQAKRQLQADNSDSDNEPPKKVPKPKRK